MDLKKLDPMARKMRTHVDAFYKALEDNDGFAARNHINEIIKYADYLSTDVESAVMKSEAISGVNDRFAGGVPVMKFNQVEKIHPASTDVLPGTIRTNRIGSIMRPQSNRTL
tara:strand:+ start:1349 stop:1684 length:336 start_codon:yes stop_codon:yes gene_type:complete